MYQFWIYKIVTYRWKVVLFVNQFFQFLFPLFVCFILLFRSILQRRAWMALLHQIKITSSFFIFFICHFFPLPLSPFFILHKIFSTRPICLGSFVLKASLHRLCWWTSQNYCLAFVVMVCHLVGLPESQKVGPPLVASLFWKPLPNSSMSSPLDPLHLIWSWMHVDGCDVLRCLFKDKAMILCWIYFLYINYGRRR